MRKLFNYDCGLKSCKNGYGLVYKLVTIKVTFLESKFQLRNSNTNSRKNCKCGWKLRFRYDDSLAFGNREKACHESVELLCPGFTEGQLK